MMQSQQHDVNWTVAEGEVTEPGKTSVIYTLKCGCTLSLLFEDHDWADAVFQAMAELSEETPTFDVLQLVRRPRVLN